MKKILLITAFTLAPFAASAALIDNFEDVGSWAATGFNLTVTESVTPALNSTDFTEGYGALAITYDFDGSLYWDGGVEKTFATPLDLSDAKEFSIDMKGDAASAQDFMIWYAQLIDINGQKHHIWLDGGDKLIDGEWRRYTWSIADLNWTEWGQPAGNTPATLTQIAKIRLLLQCQDASVPDGITTFLVDNFKYETTTTMMTETVLEDFEYADQTALEAAWVPNASTPTTAAVDLETSTAPEGSKALEESVTVVTGSTNWSGGAKFNFATPIDLATINGFTMYFKGDSTLPAAHGGVYVSLGDSSQNEVRWKYIVHGADGVYNKLVMRTKVVTNGGTSAVAEEVWDVGGGDFDRADARYIRIWYVDGNDPITPHTITVNVDAISTIASTGDPYVSIIGTDVNDWTIFH